MTDASKLESIWRYTTILSALVAMAVGVGQYRRGVSQSIKELEWKQADMARTLINGMIADEGWQAMTMLDWEEGRDYEVTPAGEYISFRLMFPWRSKRPCERTGRSARRHNDLSRTDLTAFCSG